MILIISILIILNIVFAVINLEVFARTNNLGSLIVGILNSVSSIALIVVYVKI